MKTLITGANGFLASKLIDYLVGRNNNIILSDITGIASTNWYTCDFCDFESVYLLLEKIQPAEIYHLVGSFTNDYDIDYKINVVTTKNIFDSCSQLKIKPKILIVGSAAEYGIVSENENPVKEDHQLSPVSIYGLTKTYQAMLMKYYYNVFGINVLMARPFNIYGKGISNKLVVGKVYEQIDKIKNGEAKKIVLGNLEHKRDFISVDEVAEDLFYLMQNGKAGEIYNIGKGASIKVSSLVEKILLENGFDMSFVEQNKFEKLNMLDIKDMYADTKKLLNLKK